MNVRFRPKADIPENQRRCNLSPIFDSHPDDPPTEYRVSASPRAVEIKPDGLNAVDHDKDRIGTHLCRFAPELVLDLFHRRRGLSRGINHDFTEPIVRLRRRLAQDRHVCGIRWWWTRCTNVLGRYCIDRGARGEYADKERQRQSDRCADGDGLQEPHDVFSYIEPRLRKALVNATSGPIIYTRRGTTKTGPRGNQSAIGKCAFGR